MSTSIDRDSDEVSPDSPETILQKIAKVRNSREFKFNVDVAGAGWGPINGPINIFSIFQNTRVLKYLIKSQKFLTYL